MVLLEPRHLPLADAARQAIAVEMNLSETAFLEAVPSDGQHMADGACGAAAPCAVALLRWPLRPQWHCSVMTVTNEVSDCAVMTTSITAAILLNLHATRR